MNSTKTFRVRGMHCASCGSIIERTIKKINGVESVAVNNGTENAKISFDESKTNPEQFNQKLEPLGYSLATDAGSHDMGSMNMTASEMGMSADEHAAHLGLSQSKKEKLAEIKAMKIKVISAIPLALISIFVMGWSILLQYNAVPAMSESIEGFLRYLMPILATYILFIVGKPYLFGFYRFLRYGKANMDTLIGIGTLAAYLYSFAVTVFAEPLRQFINVEVTYYDVTIIVITFIALGKFLEARSKLKTGDAIEKLLNLQAKTALMIRDGKEQEVPVGQVVHGEIPVDGIIVDGSSYVDEAMVTGEPMPVEKKAGDMIVAGTINTSGYFTFKA